MIMPLTPFHPDAEARATKFKSYSDYIEQMELDALDPVDTPVHSITNEVNAWTGHMDFKEATRHALIGWRKGEDEIRQKIDSVGLTMVQKDSFIDTAVSGFRPLIPAVIAGHPESMQSIDTGDTGKRVITLNVSYGFHAGISSDAVYNYGAAICWLVDEMNNKGVRVAVNMYCGHKSDGKKAYLVVPLKKANEPLDLSRIGFNLCNPASFRRIGFRWIEHYEQFKRCRHGGYGRTIDEPDMRLFDDGSVVLRGAGVGEWDCATDAEELLDCLYQQLTHSDNRDKSPEQTKQLSEAVLDAKKRAAEAA